VECTLHLAEKTRPAAAHVHRYWDWTVFRHFQGEFHLALIVGLDTYTLTLQYEEVLGSEVRSFMKIPSLLHLSNQSPLFL
jgi:hypothetical protein